MEASIDGRPVALGAGKRRALLARLALHEGSTVSADRLVDGLWGEQPPPSAPKMVQMHISLLRRALADAGGGARIVTRGQGYELRLGEGEADTRRFQTLVGAGAAREALALWRGPALDDVAGEPFAAPEIRRLDELRLAACEQAIEADLAAGRHRDVLAELDALAQEQPLRERVHYLRMLALYRSGRQAEALHVYRSARRTLVDEIGVEPGLELRKLHEAILRQDPALDPPQRPPLPAELDAGTPLAGREADLEWLHEQWRPANAGSGRLVVCAPDLQRGEVPVQRLLEASGGLPRRLHRLAAKWAHEDAEARVAADAQRAGWRVPRRISRAASRRCGPSASVPARGPARASWNARSRASRRSTWPTLRTSSGASGWWPRWWRGWPASRSSASSDRGAAASRPRCAPVCSPSWRRACSPGANPRRASCRTARGHRPDQPADCRRAVRHRQERRVAPRQRLPQARHPRARPARRRALTAGLEPPAACSAPAAPISTSSPLRP